jgi:hypothetical protein
MSAICPADSQRHVSVFGSDLGVFNLAWRPALWLSGREDRAKADADEAVRLAQTLGHALQPGPGAGLCGRAATCAAIGACVEAADAARLAIAADCRLRTLGCAYGMGTRQTIPRRRRATCARPCGARPGRSLGSAPSFAARRSACGSRTTLRPGGVDEAEHRMAASSESLWAAELARRARFSCPAGRRSRPSGASARPGMHARLLALRSAVTLSQAMRAAGGGRRGDVVREVLAAVPDGVARASNRCAPSRHPVKMQTIFWRERFANGAPVSWVLDLDPLGGTLPPDRPRGGRP